MQEKKRVIALGFFDGVHLGHAALLRRVRSLAGELDTVPAALTFDRLPKTLVQGAEVPLINTPEDRTWLLKQLYGMAEVIELPFDRATMELPWQRFVTEILVGRFHAAHVVAGHDYRFGHRGEGDVSRLRELCLSLGIGCDVVDCVALDGTAVSSTRIRALIEQGDMESACKCLGHPHILSGAVTRGKQVGRTIGIPTANLVIPEQVIVPAYGVYATLVDVEGSSFMAVTNVGVRPTLDDGRGVTVEPWLLDFNGDLYGRTIRVEFYKQLRGERKFADLEQLRREILHNAEQTREYFQARPV